MTNKQASKGNKEQVKNYSWKDILILILPILSLLYSIYFLGFNVSSLIDFDRYSIFFIISAIIITFYMGCFLCNSKEVEEKFQKYIGNNFWLLFLLIIGIIFFIVCYLFLLVFYNFELTGWKGFIYFLFIFMELIIGIFFILNLIVILMNIINLKLKSYLSSNEVNDIIYKEILMYSNVKDSKDE